MKPPIKNLIGGVEELHTREYFLKISAQTMGYRESSKFWGEEQQERKFEEQNSCFWGERERGRRSTWLGADTVRIVLSLLVGYPKWKVRCSVAANFPR